MRDKQENKAGQERDVSKGRLKQRPEGNEGMICMDMGSGDSKCQGSSAETCLPCLGNNEEIIISGGVRGKPLEVRLSWYEEVG